MASSYRFRPAEGDEIEFHPPPEAPVFEPTASEFEDPLEYIEKIKPIGEKYGICKVKPPPEWQPPFVVDIKKFQFNPRIQRINELEARTRIKLNFTERIMKFWSLQGSTLQLPYVGGKFLDIYLLYHLVETEGGFYSVCEENKWAKIITKMGLNMKYVNEVKANYEKILFPYSLFSQKANSDMDPKNFTLMDPKEEDIILRYADESVKKNIEEARRLQGSENNNYKEDRKKRTYPVLEKYICINCNGGDDEDQMLLCDGCDDSYHTFCLVPPLMQIPEGDWRCPLCVARDLCVPSEAYGFEQAPNSYTLQEFGAKADKFKEDYFGTIEVPTEQVEKEFWNILSRVHSNVTVEYGADLHTVEHGSGFPSKQSVNMSQDPQAHKYLESPWNLNNLPVLSGSVLRYINADISGMKVPWTYVGMCFATFCWHNEDHWSYSINYLHWGEPKTWYGIPGRCADEFETVIRTAAPELFDDHPNLLHNLTTILNPNVVMGEGVPVFRTDQQAGEFVITFPRAYHAGFNQGYNFAEAVNFAPLDWVPIGRECINYYSSMKRENVFSHEELVCDIASQVEVLPPITAVVIYHELLNLVNTEKKFRHELFDWGVRMNEEYFFENYPDDQRQCDFCKCTCYVSCVVCRCRNSYQKIACYRHYREVCFCPPSNHILRFRWKLKHLITLVNKLQQKAVSYEAWVRDIRQRQLRASDSKGTQTSYAKQVSSEWRY